MRLAEGVGSVPWGNLLVLIEEKMLSCKHTKLCGQTDRHERTDGPDWQRPRTGRENGTEKG